MALVTVTAYANALATNVMARDLEFLLAQRPFMRQLCAYKGDILGRGSAVIKVGQIDYGDTADEVAEGASTSSTNITTATYSLTPARYAIERDISDLVGMASGTGFLDPRSLAEFNFVALMRGFDGALCSAAGALTNTVGSTGVDMTVTDWFSAVQQLTTTRAVGPKAAVFAPNSFNELQSDLRGEVGPYQLDTSVQAIVADASGGNFVGRLSGVDIWVSSQCAGTANGGADNGNFMCLLPGGTMDAGGRRLGSACFGYAEGSPGPTVIDGARVMSGTTVYTDISRDNQAASTRIVSNYFFAVGVAEEDKGVGIFTDA